MTLSRRNFLTRLLSTAAVISAGPVVKVIPAARDIVPVGNRFPYWEAEQEKFLEGLSQRALKTIVYGTADTSPLRFTGFRALA